MNIGRVLFYLRMIARAAPIVRDIDAAFRAKDWARAETEWNRLKLLLRW